MPRVETWPGPVIWGLEICGNDNNARACQGICWRENDGAEKKQLFLSGESSLDGGRAGRRGRLRIIFEDAALVARLVVAYGRAGGATFAADVILTAAGDCRRRREVVVADISSGISAVIGAFAAKDLVGTINHQARS